MTAAAPAVTTAGNPYVGPRPFEREDEDKLFGREEETRELLAVITSTPITLVYAQSGAGKTSLLKAKLLPLLERWPCEVYGPLRAASPDPPQSGVRNCYTYNALLSLCAGSQPIPPDLASLSLADFLRRQPKPEAPRGSIRKPRVLVFDQFEDLFTRYAERWEDRGRFFDDVGVALEDDPRLRIVFAMREEYLAAFEAYAAALPPASVGRFRLERLRRSAAEDAARKPLEAAGAVVGQETVDKLVDDLMALPETAGWPARYEEFAEAVQLQIVCCALWEATREKRAEAAALGRPIEIGVEDVRSHGDVEQALRDYYDRSMEEIAASYGGKYRFQVGKLRTWFERTFINDEGQRSMVYKGATETAGFPNEVLDALQSQKYLVRNEPRGTTTWYELSHERFIKPILDSNESWRRKADPSRRVGALEARALLWRDAGRPADQLLTGAELRLAQDLIPGDPGEAGASKILEEYLQKSAAQRQQRSARQLRLIVALSVVGILAVVGIAYQANRTLRAAHGKALASVAGQMLQEQRPLDAMTWGIKAVREAPGQADAVSALRQALQITSPSAEWLQRRNAPIVGCSFSPDGKSALTQSLAELCLWNLDRGGAPNCQAAPQSLHWSDAQMMGDGPWVIATAEDEQKPYSFLWRPNETAASRLQRLPSLPWRVQRCGALLFGDDRRLSLFDPRATEPPTPESGLLVDLRAGALSPDCTSYVLVLSPPDATTPPRIILRSSADLARELPVDDAFDRDSEPSFDDSGRYVLFARTGTVRASVYDVQKGEQVFSLGFYPPAAKVTIVGQSVVAEKQVGDEKILEFYDLHTGSYQRRADDLQTEDVRRGSLINVGVKSSGNSSAVDVLDLRSLRRSHTTIPASGFDDVTVSPEARRLMTRKKGVVRIWSVNPPPATDATLSPSELIVLACQQLRRFGNDTYVRDECAQ
jgi:hypothetical protein